MQRRNSLRDWHFCAPFFGCTSTQTKIPGHVSFSLWRKLFHRQGANEFFRAGYSWPLRNYSHHANSITLTTKSIIVPLRRAFSARRAAICQPRSDILTLPYSKMRERAGENPTLVASCVSICGTKVAVSPLGSYNSGLQDAAAGGRAL